MVRFPTHPPGDAWALLLRLRWPLGGAVVFAFALGRFLESLLLGGNTPARLAFDLVFWGLLGGSAVWLSLTWASRQERRHQAGLAQALRQEQRANRHLSLLSTANRQFVGSASLDDILDTAVTLPRQLLPTCAAALVLRDDDGAIDARLAGVAPPDLARWRTVLGLPIPLADWRQPHLLPVGARGEVPGCLLVPLHDGVAPVGALELYLRPGVAPDADELALLETIGSEIAEAIVGARRRTREERALHEMERAIGEERARIARDIHDGLAQSLAFNRMRVDLWLDWIADDPDRLRAELRTHKDHLREQIRELRRAIFALRPLEFDEFGFLGGLHRYILEFAGQQGWQVAVDLAAAPGALTPESEAATFRIVQEALTNAAKHAAATEVTVRIAGADGGMLIGIRDNGRGFDPGTAADTAAGRVGLRQMRERLAVLRGHLTVLSRPGAGAEVRAWLPLPPAPGGAGQPVEALERGRS